MLIPPRLNKLLQLLLESEAPAPAGTLAEKLGVSRRTVFRELENIGGLLEPYGLALVTKAGEGLRMEGPEKGRKELLEALREEDREPADKRERIQRLLLELLRTPDLQKIYAYAARFKVSEGTISNDLEAANGWLEKYRLTLTRRPGLGIGVEGEEVDFRRALIRLLELSAAGELRRLARHGFLDPGVLEEVCAILRGLHDPQHERMTEDSQARLAIYLAVVTERVRAGRVLDGEPEETPTELALRLSDALEQSFSITLTEAERGYVAVQISGARAKYMDRRQEEAMDSYELQRLACRMIDRFDSSTAYELKMDEALVRGLTFHLRSAVVRLRYGLELQDPLLGQMEQSYPEVFEKSRRAAQVLWEEYRRPVSESEVGFLSMHFGAAVMRLRERQTHRRTVHVGVLCVNGIGVSYMMASQIKARFQDDVEVEVCVREDAARERFDFCVSSIPFESPDLAVIETKPILEDADMARIGAEINRRACLRDNVPDGAAGWDFTEQLQRLEWLSHDIRALLDQFRVVPVDMGSTFGDLVKLAGYQFGNSPESGHSIYADLMSRERVATQVVAEYGFVLLHARTAGVEEAVFSLLHPEQPFTDPYLQGVRTAVVMLVPEDRRPDRGKMMGAVSSALVEESAFLEAVRGGSAGAVRGGLERILRAFLAENMKQWIGT